MSNHPDIDFPPDLQVGDGPLFSVVFATYEPSKYIRQALESVIKQTYDNIELVVVDSSEIDWLRRLGEVYDWVEYVPQEPSGVAAAWNRGIEAATGEIVGFLADDDFFAPEKLERQVEAIEAGTDIVYSDEYIIDEDGNTTRLRSLPVEDPETHYIEFFRAGHGVPHLTVAGRIECFGAEPFSESLNAREDPHLWVRIFREYEPAHIPEPLAYKRRRSNSLTSDPDMMYENEMHAVADLVDRFEELEPYQAERELATKYRYGKQLLHAGRIREARRVLLDAFVGGHHDYRVIAMLALSYLPVGRRRVFQTLEKAHEAIRWA